MKSARVSGRLIVPIPAAPETPAATHPPLRPRPRPRPHPRPGPAPQEKSYFSLALPHGWWVFGLDLALVGDIDMCQYR
jgi:hypothetical protein